MNQTTRTPWGSRLRALALALALALPPLLGLAPAAAVQAASGDCTSSGAQVSCTFSYTGAEQSWQLPPGVSSVQVTAVVGTLAHLHAQQRLHLGHLRAEGRAQRVDGV